MAEDLSGVLREISALLQRMTEQNDVAARERAESRVRWDANKEQREANQRRIEESSKRWETSISNRPDFKKQAEEMRTRMEESRVLQDKRREEDVQFRQKLLYEIERHNQLLETLIAKLVAGTVDS